LLLDEIEKAHPDTFNILLQVLDEGRLTDNKGRLANFRNTIIIMTSNMGSHIIQQKFENIDMNQRMSVVEETKIAVLSLLKSNIRPEFLNRIDEIIMFTPLNLSEIKAIVRIQLRSLKNNLVTKNIGLDFADNAIDFISELGYDPQFGARPIKRVIQREVLNELSKKILAEEIAIGSTIMINVDRGKLVFNNA